MSIKELKAERKNVQQTILCKQIALKKALLNGRLVQARTEQCWILKEQLRIKQINFKIKTQLISEEIAAFERSINEEIKI